MYYGTDPVTEEILGCFLAIQHNFEKDEVETTAQATWKRKKADKTPARSKVLDLCWELHQFCRNLHKFLSWSKSVKSNTEMKYRNVVYKLHHWNKLL